MRHGAVEAISIAHQAIESSWYRHRGRQAVCNPINDHVVSICQCFLELDTLRIKMKRVSRYNLGIRKLLLSGRSYANVIPWCMWQFLYLILLPQGQSRFAWPGYHCGWKSDLDPAVFVGILQFWAKNRVIVKMLIIASIRPRHSAHAVLPESRYDSCWE